MSLQIAAQHIAHEGRGPDTTLVHMSRDEVKSLNDLAMAHGGQLTINPQTGLPEAGFLSSLLPMIAGAALNVAMPGSGMLVPALVGGASMLMNPKAGLMGGLMAGLGAYGGANLGEALASQGMEKAAGQKLLEGQVADNVTQMGSNLPSSGVIPRLAPGEVLPYGTGMSGTMASGDMPAVLNANQYGAGMSPTDLKAGFAAQSMADRFGTVGQGIGSLTQPGGLSGLGSKLGGYSGIAQTALAAAAPAATQQAAAPAAAVGDKDMGQRYKFNPGTAQPLPAPDVPTYEDILTKQGNFGKMQSYFPGQGYAQVTPDQAKNIYGFAGGGPVEQMSNNAAIGANTMYPMANMATSAFATPYQDPKSTNMMSAMAPSGGGTVDAMSGEPNMQGTRLAAGGVSYDPKTQQYAKGISATLPENRDVNMYNDTGGPGSAGGNNTSNSPGTSNGSPTGSTIGDIMYAIADQPFSPMAAMMAQAVTDATSSTSPTSANATNGMDVASDAASAASAAAAAANDSGGAPGMGGGPGPSSASDGGGDSGEARGGLSPRFKYHMATGGISDAGYNLGGYSDGGRLLRGPGDGVSDSIPASIGHKQPARLADGEFVVPARIVSELGNGSTEAGARKLYAMMDRVQAARGKTVGKGRVAKNSRADKYLPA